jgi:hypothetical protein
MNSILTVPIRPFLSGEAFDPETIREMSLALWEPTRNQEEQQYAAYHGSLLRPGIAGRISTDWNCRDGND